jgi:DNA-binding protein H-NS
MSDQATIAELEAQRAALDAQIEAAKAASMAGAIAAVKALMESSSVTLEMLGGRKARAPRAAAAAAPKQTRSTKGGKVAAKFRGTDEEGNPVTWSGRGLQPKWLTKAIAAGATLESFAVTAEAA